MYYILLERMRSLASNRRGCKSRHASDLGQIILLFLSLICLIHKMDNRMPGTPNHLAIGSYDFPNNIHEETALHCQVM